MHRNRERTTRAAATTIRGDLSTLPGMPGRSSIDFHKTLAESMW